PSKTVPSAASSSTCGVRAAGLPVQPRVSQLCSSLITTSTFNRGLISLPLLLAELSELSCPMGQLSSDKLLRERRGQQRVGERGGQIALGGGVGRVAGPVDQLVRVRGEVEQLGEAAAVG